MLYSYLYCYFLSIVWETHHAFACFFIPRPNGFLTISVQCFRRRQIRVIGNRLTIYFYCCRYLLDMEAQDDIPIFCRRISFVPRRNFHRVSCICRRADKTALREDIFLLIHALPIVYIDGKTSLLSLVIRENVHRQWII